MHAMSFLKCALLYQNEPHPRFKILFFQPPLQIFYKWKTEGFFLNKKTFARYLWIIKFEHSYTKETLTEYWNPTAIG